MEQFEIVAGTYEEFLLGYKFMLNSSSLVQSFASHDHSSSIRSLANSDHLLASGATDDRIIIYDLKTRKEHCMLTHHNSTINCIQFTNNHSHVISGSADGVLAVVRVGNWQLEKVWEKAHNGTAISDIAVHPSGKLALTLGGDTSLRTWNLVKGRQAYIINLNSKSKDARSLEKILWAEDEVRFLLYGGKYTEIWSIEVGGILKSIEHGNKVCSCVWYNDKEIIVGYENGQIARVNIETSSKITHDAHDNRVKALAKYKKWIVSASSSGEIKVWNKHFEQQARGNSGCRITCLILTKILGTKKDEKNDLVEVKDETIQMPTQTGSVVVIEVEDDSDKKQVNKKRNSKNQSGQMVNLNDEHIEKNKQRNIEEIILSTKTNKNKKRKKLIVEHNELEEIETNDQFNNYEGVKKKKKNKKNKGNVL